MHLFFRVGGSNFYELRKMLQSDPFDHKPFVCDSAFPLTNFCRTGHCFHSVNVTNKALSLSDYIKRLLVNCSEAWICWEMFTRNMSRSVEVNFVVSWLRDRKCLFRNFGPALRFGANSRTIITSGIVRFHLVWDFAFQLEKSEKYKSI
jgi:hypothetical protein